MTKGIYYGWWVVFGAACTLFVCGGIGFASLPVFLKFIEADMQWGRGSLSIAGGISALAAGFAAPVVGHIIDRHSVRGIMLPGAALVAVSFFLLSRVESIGQLYFLYLAVGIGMAATTILPSQTLVSRWFEKRRGRAMGIITASGALGSMIWTPVTDYLIESMGWRDAYEVLGICIAVFSLPFIWLTIRNSPQAMGLALDGQLEPEAETAPGADEPLASEKMTDYSVREALGTSSFWLIFLAIFLVAIASAGFGLHIIAFLSDSGLSSSQAAIAWSLTIGVSIIGRFIFGYLSEGRQKRYFASAANHCRALSIFLLVLLAIGLLPLAAVTLQLVLIYGLALGCNNVINPLLVSETFGVKAFGRIMGLFGIPFTIGMALGMIAAGQMYEFHENYKIAFSAFAVAFILAGTAIVFAKPHFLINARLANGEQGN